MWIFKVGVVGAGAMGGGIGQVVTFAGLPVVVALIFAVGLGCRYLGLLPYHGGDVSDSLLVWVALLAAMAPLAVWFAKVKRTSKSWFIRMI